MKSLTRITKSFQFILLSLIIIGISSGCRKNKSGESVTITISKNLNRIWTGPEIWANPLQDWLLDDGKIICRVSDMNRNINLLTYRVEEVPGTFLTEVNTGLISPQPEPGKNNWVGFRIGIRGDFNDYRDDAIYGTGIDAGITTGGELFIGQIPVKNNGNAKALIPHLKQQIRLRLFVTPSSDQDGLNTLHLQALEPGKKEILAEIEKSGFEDQELAGALSLVSSWANPGNMKDTGSVWFNRWHLEGTRLKHYPERKFGPVLFTQYTLSNKTLKLTAQLPPLDLRKNPELILESRLNSGDDWEEINRTAVDPMARTATFRVENWDDTQDWEYRIKCPYTTLSGKSVEDEYSGTIRRNPKDKAEIVLAGFTGNNDLGFPNNDLVKSVQQKEPDLLFFSGDQIYESVGGYGTQRAPLELAVLDYLRKWYLFGWEYGNLLRNTPSISIPDDHDVYHGNIWGAGGKATPPGLTGNEAQDSGGYKMPADWVNMVQRTQTSHLPDPYDPTPVQQGIGVYYTNLNWGGISFAILEDRKFKAAPAPLLPKARITNGWPQNRNFNMKRYGDVPSAPLLGNRQLDFLENWVEDWSNGIWMKTVLSQTIFANVATLPAGEYHDRVVPKLRILKPGEYPPNDRPVTDMDSNGWPQSGRNRALKVIRKAFALHIAGDQHLGSTIQYGVDDWHDASYAFCVPAISNIWPRRWFPARGGMNREKGAPKYTGDFYDGFGNRMSVYAVSNPVYTGFKPSNLYDRATGFGIVRFVRETRNIIIECWPRNASAKKGQGHQYPGWPITLNQLDNYGGTPAEYLPEIECIGLENPIVRVYRSNGELYYALRIRGTTFKPFVYQPGSYTVVVGDPDRNKTKRYENLAASKLQTAKIRVNF